MFENQNRSLSSKYEGPHLKQQQLTAPAWSINHEKGFYKHRLSQQTDPSHSGKQARLHARRRLSKPSHRQTMIPTYPFSAQKEFVDRAPHPREIECEYLPINEGDEDTSRNTKERRADAR